MALINWSDEIYSVGITKMDEQHKQLIGLINALAKGNHADPEFMDRVISTLVLYTKTHFADEERILKKLQFPELTHHKRQHEQFIDQVKHLQREYHANHGSRALLDRIAHFLRDWINHHILVEDKAYRHWLEA